MPVEFGPSHDRDDGIIFVIEGDEVVRSALHFILGHRNETHSFATLYLAHAREPHITPDLVLLGIDLLKCGGQSVVSGIRRRFPVAKIMIVANSVDDPLARKALRWGAHDVLGKPISFSAIHRRVDGLLRRQKPATTLRRMPPPPAAW